MKEMFCRWSIDKEQNLAVLHELDRETAYTEESLAQTYANVKASRRDFATADAHQRALSMFLSGLVLLREHLKSK